MEKQKRITLNADKRKVIANVFQDYYESNSKYHKAWQDAKDKYTVCNGKVLQRSLLSMWSRILLYVDC